VLRNRGEIPGFEHLTGRALDRGLVVLEQTLVQSFIDSYAWPNQAKKSESLDRISKGFQSYFANDWVKAIVQRLFGERFDFGNIDARIRLGCEIVEMLRLGG
jgi:hypothetical protein